MDDADIEWMLIGSDGAVLRLSDVVLLRHMADVADCGDGTLRQDYASSGDLTATVHWPPEGDQ